MPSEWYYSQDGQRKGPLDGHMFGKLSVRARKLDCGGRAHAFVVGRVDGDGGQRIPVEPDGRIERPARNRSR